MTLSGEDATLLGQLEGTLAFRALAEEIPQLVWVSRDGRTPTFLNRQWADYTGSPHEWLSQGETIWSLVHPDDIGTSTRDWQAALEADAPYETQFRLRRHDGQYRWFLVRGTPVRGEDGTIVAWFGTCTDIEENRSGAETLRFISDAGVVLSRSLDLQSTLDALLGLIVPQFGDCAWVNVAEPDGSLRTIAMLHKDPAAAEAVGTLRGETFVDSQAEYASPMVQRTGRPMIVEITPATIERTIRPEFRDAFARLGLRTGVVVPMRSEKGVLGTASIGSVGERDYSKADVPILEEISVRAALAIQNARLYERERRIAVVLQEAQTPKHLPAIPGVRLDAAYVAAIDEARVGGDWYDAFELPGGKLFLSIGDVCGHGLGSVATMTAMRQRLRACAVLETDPARMLDAVDRTLQIDGGDELVTAFVAVFDAAAGVLTYASAGHPPALLRTAGGDVVPLFRPDLPLGHRFERSVPSTEVRLEDGAIVVLYTDGLIEIGRDLIAGERELLAALADPSFPRNDDLSAALCARLLPAGTRDDVAILTLRYDRSRRGDTALRER
jgi:PAS domain S-box-containing protein